MKIKEFSKIMQSGSREQIESTLTNIINTGDFSDKVYNILCEMRGLNESISSGVETSECLREFFALLQKLLNTNDFKNYFLPKIKPKTKTEKLSGVDYYGDPDEYQEEFLETDDFPKRRFDSDVPNVGEVYIDEYGNRIRKTM